MTNNSDCKSLISFKKYCNTAFAKKTKKINRNKEKISCIFQLTILNDISKEGIELFKSKLEINSTFCTLFQRQV